MSSFLDELRREVVDAHEAHAARTRGRARTAFRRRPPLRVALGGALLAGLLAVFAVLAARERTDPAPVAPRIVGELRIGGSPVDAVGFEGSLWIADSAGRSVVRVDPEARRVVSRIAIGGQPGFIAAADDGGLWVHAGRSGTDMATVSQIDPDSDRVIARATVGPEGPMTVAAGFVWAAVWASDDNRPLAGLYRVDAGSRRTLPRIPLTGVDDFAAAGATVWALTSNGTLARLDALTGRIERRWTQLGVPAGTAAGANAMVARGDGVWVLSTPQVGEGSLVHVSGDRVDRRLPLAPSASPVLAVARDGLWTAHGNDLRDRYRLTRVDPVSGRVTATVSLGSRRPVALVPMGQELWVAGDDGTVVIVGA
jgi:DNA-binding beta-propeller fold protein YncE